MAGMNLSGGFAAGAGADALQQQLQTLFQQAIAKQHMAQEQQRIEQENRRMSMADADRQAALADLTKSRAVQNATKLTGMLQKGQALTPQTVGALQSGDMGDLVQHEAADLPSTAISGIAQAGAKAPSVGPLRIVGAGRPERDTFTGTAAQAEQEQARQDALAAREAARQEREGARTESEKNRAAAAAETQKGREELIRLTASLRPAQQPALMVIQAPDGTTKVVPKVAGASYEKAKPANAALDNRVASAKVVNEVGSDIIRKLNDPAFIAAVGPVMGRSASLRDFIGNPPPQFSELAGQIESYALANMGVHGMRSAQGAEAIKKLLDQRHTPQSLAATIRGLNDFSNRLVTNEAKPGGEGSPAASGAAPKVVRYDMNGNPIKD